jgi:hypothetical protein
MLRASDRRFRLLRDALADLEPFKTVLELASRHGKAASRQVAKALRDEVSNGTSVPR